MWCGCLSTEQADRRAIRSSVVSQIRTGRRRRIRLASVLRSVIARQPLSDTLRNIPAGMPTCLSVPMRHDCTILITHQTGHTERTHTVCEGFAGEFHTRIRRFWFRPNRFAICHLYKTYHPVSIFRLTVNLATA